MLKLYSNGSHLPTLFSIHLKNLFLYSTSSITKDSSYNTCIVDYLVNSLGFSKEEAITASKKVSSSRLKSIPNTNFVINFLKEHKFNDTHIKKIVSLTPDLLWYNVSKTLGPKFIALQELGIKGSDLVHVVSSNPSIIRRSLSTKLYPMMSYLKHILGSHENFMKVVRRSFWLMSSDVSRMLKPNIELFRRYGFSNGKIRTMLVLQPEIFGYDPKKLEEVLIRVEEELGIPRNSAVFTNGIVFLVSASDKTRESKYELLRSFGWTENDIKITVQKFPRALMLSETLLRHRLEIFINELGCKPAYIASRPYVLSYSMETRVVPRNAFLQVLKERKLKKGNLGILASISLSEPRFLELYVLPFKDELPELCEAYIHRKKVSPARKAAC